MPTNIFLELGEEKRNKITRVSIDEFAKYGYENSSTNRIVQNAGISKGSLFKYFKNKDELYFYILDSVTQELIVSLAKEIDFLPKELFERIIKYSELEFDWYIKHPNEYKLIATAFTKSNTEIYQKVEAQYGLEGQSIYYKLLYDVDTSVLRFDKEKSIDILKWFLTGFNEDFLSHIQIQENTNIDNIRQEYVNSLTDHITILKCGLISEKKEV
ncbi:TetR/AcrR family transcriptional regulator [Clostridioides difficile]|nr:TetR/AcrR family transcriptional regulator [Clostridioides difficile]